MPVTPKIVPADPQAWSQGFLNLRPSVVPCPGLTQQSSAGVHENCVDFLDRWADEAAGLEFIPENGGGAGIRFRERKAPAE